MQALEFFNEMTSSKVANIVAEYSGAGDEGQIEYVTLLDAQGAPIDSASLERTAENFIDDVLSEAVGGYENHEGGRGDVSIDAISRTGHFGHGFYGEPEFYAEPFDICVNVVTGELEVKKLTGDEEIARQDTAVLKHKAACWDVMRSALDDIAKGVSSSVDAVAVGFQLRQEFMEGKEDGVQDDHSKRTGPGS